MSDPASVAAAAALAEENRRMKEELETMKACYEAALGALHTKTTTPTAANGTAAAPVAAAPAAAAVVTPTPVVAKPVETPKPVAVAAPAPAAATPKATVVTTATSPTTTASPPPSTSTAATTSSSTIAFLPTSSIDKVTYQGNWAKLPISTNLELWLQQAITSDEIEALLKDGINLLTFASGQVGHTMKFFLFSREKEVLSLYLVQMEIDTQSGKLTAIFKTDSPNAVQNTAVLKKMVQDALVSVALLTPLVTAQATPPQSTPPLQAREGTGGPVLNITLTESASSPTSTHPAASPRSLRPRFPSSANIPPSVSFTDSLDFSTNFTVPAGLKHQRATSLGIAEEIDPNAQSRAPSRSQTGREREEGQMVTPLPSGQGNGLDDSSLDFDTKFTVPNGIPRNMSFGGEQIDSGATSIAHSVRSSNADMLSPVSLSSISRTTSGTSGHRKNVQSYSHSTSTNTSLNPDGTLRNGGHLVTPNSTSSYLNGVDDGDLDFSTTFNVPSHVRHARAQSSAEEVIDGSAMSKSPSVAPSVRSSNADLFAPLRRNWDGSGSGPASSGASSDEESNSDSDEEFYEFGGHGQQGGPAFNPSSTASTGTTPSGSPSSSTGGAPPPVVRRQARPSVSAFQKPTTPASTGTTPTAAAATGNANATTANATVTPTVQTQETAVVNVASILTPTATEEVAVTTPKVKVIPEEVLRQRELASGAAAAMAAMQAKMALKRGGSVVPQQATSVIVEPATTTTTASAPMAIPTKPATNNNSLSTGGLPASNSFLPAAGTHFVFKPQSNSPATATPATGTPDKTPHNELVISTQIVPTGKDKVEVTIRVGDEFVPVSLAPPVAAPPAAGSVAALIAAGPQLIGQKITPQAVSTPQIVDFNVSTSFITPGKGEDVVSVQIVWTPVYAAVPTASTTAIVASPSPTAAAATSPTSPTSGASTQYLISKEVYETESRFVGSMSILQEVYITPCSSAMNTRDERIMGDTIFDTRIQVFFATATQILKLNSKFLSEIKNVIDAWTKQPELTSPPVGTPTLSSVILNYAPLFQIFSSYAKDHEIVSTLLLNAAKPGKSSDPVFEKFVAKTMAEGRTNGQPLDSLLVQAVQRLPRYKLLLDELLRKSAPSDRGYNELKQAIEQVSAVALHVNETIRHREQNEALSKIEDQFDTSAQTQYKRINLRDREPPRHLIREGSLNRLTRSGHTSYYFHLFNDCLLYSDIKTNGLFKLHRWVNFYDSVAITDKSILPAPGQMADDTTQYSIEVRSPAKSFLISFQNRLEKDAWLNDFNTCLDIIKKEKEQDGTASSFVAPVWTQDGQQTICGMKGCGKEFSLFNRRHHCRVCGILVCALCSKNKRMIPSVDEKKPVRVCDACVREQHEAARAAKSGAAVSNVASNNTMSLQSPVKRPAPPARSGISAFLTSNKNATLPMGFQLGIVQNPTVIVEEKAGDGHDEEGENGTTNGTANGTNGTSTKTANGDATTSAATNGTSPTSASSADSLNPLLDDHIPEYRRSLFALSRAYPNDTRLTCAIELYLSEITYCKELEVLISHFVTPLLKQISTGKKGLLSNQTTTLLLGRAIPSNLLIFLNAFQPLYTLALELHKLLHAKIVTGEDPSSTSVSQATPTKPAGWNPHTTTFGSLFLRFANLFDMYVEYSSNHQQALQTLTDSPDDNILYKEIFLKYESDVKGEMEKIQAEQTESNEYARKKERAWAATPQAIAAAAIAAQVNAPPATPSAASSSRMSIVSTIAAPINLDEPHTHTSLHDLLTAPFMRVSKYVWLLSSLLRATPEGHPDNIVDSTTSAGGDSDLHLLATALRAVQKSLNNINGAILTGDNLTKLTKLQDRFVGNPKDLDLIAPHRFLIKEGVLNRHTRKGSERYLFHLLSDLLLYSEINVQGKYKLHRRLPLMTLQCVDSGSKGGDRCSFEIHSPIKSFVIVAANENEKNEWIEQIMLAIKNEEKRSMHAAATLSPKSGAAPTAALMQREAIMTTAPLWAKDSTAKQCPLCQTKFTLLTRKHHCRACGTVCCDDCSPDRRVIASLGETKPVRVCVKCAPNFK